MSCSLDIVKDIKRLAFNLKLLPVVTILLFIATSIMGVHYGFDSHVITLSMLLMMIELFIVMETYLEMEEFIKAANKEREDEV